MRLHGRLNSLGIGLALILNISCFDFCWL